MPRLNGAGGGAGNDPAFGASVAGSGRGCLLGGKCCLVGFAQNRAQADDDSRGGA